MNPLIDFRKAESMPNKHNILMFHVDNIGVGDLGCYGGA